MGPVSVMPLDIASAGPLPVMPLGIAVGDLFSVKENILPGWNSAASGEAVVRRFALPPDLPPPFCGYQPCHCVGDGPGYMPFHSF